MAYNKHAWETKDQCHSRFGFIKEHEDKFDDRRLASLSNAWSNWKFLGCRYSQPVQLLLEQLNLELPPDLQASGRPKTLNKIAFKRSSPESNLSAVAPNDVMINGLTIYEPFDTTNMNSVCILNESCQKSGKFLEFQDLGWKEQDGNTFLHTTASVIDDKFIASGTGSNKKISKHACAGNALEILRKCQPVLSKTSPNHDRIQQVNKTDLIKESYENSEKLKEDNVGNKLLRKMGWSGTGGLSSRGIADPVFLDVADGRRGFGHTKDPGSLKSRNVDEVIKRFISEDKESQIKFSSDLSREDRALVHKMCQKYGLGHKSFGKGQERYLVITKQQR